MLLLAAQASLHSALCGTAVDMMTPLRGTAATRRRASCRCVGTAWRSLPRNMSWASRDEHEPRVQHQGLCACSTGCIHGHNSALEAWSAQLVGLHCSLQHRPRLAPAHCAAGQSPGHAQRRHGLKVDRTDVLRTASLGCCKCFSLSTEHWQGIEWQHCALQEGHVQAISGATAPADLGELKIH